MYTAKILNLSETEDLTLDVVEVQFTSGDKTLTKSFHYDDYRFQTKVDIMNMIAAECAILDEKEAQLSEITAFVGVDDVVSEIKSTLPTPEEPVTE